MMFYSLRQTFFFLPSALGTSNFVIARERALLPFLADIFWFTVVLIFVRLGLLTHIHYTVPRSATSNKICDVVETALSKVTQNQSQNRYREALILWSSTTLPNTFSVLNNMLYIESSSYK